MRRWLLLLLLLLGLVLLATPVAVAVALNGDWRQELGGLETRELEKFLDEIDRQLKDYAPEFRLRSVLPWGSGVLDLAALLRGLGRYLFREVLANSRLLGQMVIMAVVAALLVNLQAAFEREAVTRLAYAVVYLALATLALGGFTTAMEAARSMVNTLVELMQALLPLLLTLMAGAGAITSAGLFHPAMVFVIYAVSFLTTHLVLPFIFFAVVLELAGTLSESFKVTYLSALLRQVGLGALGVLLSLFLGVVAVQGAVGAVADGVALRTAKFVTGNFVPVVGKMFADTVEVVFGSSLLLKNALGLAGALAILLTAAFPLLKILSFYLIYRLGAALIQPLGAGRVVEALHSMASALSFILLASLLVSLMFFLGVTVIIGTGNSAAMLR